MTAVDEGGELDAVGTPVVEQRLDGRPCRASGVEDVVDDDDGRPLDAEVDVGGVDDRRPGLRAAAPRSSR